MSKGKTSNNDEILSAYFKHSVPAQWVAWWSELPESDEKVHFETIIFENGQLRSLDNKDIRLAVLNFIKASRLMRAIVLDEAHETIDKIAESAIAILKKRQR